MLKKSLLWVLMLASLGPTQGIANGLPLPGQGATLMSLGFYAGAEDAYREELASGGSASTIKGLFG